MGYNSLSFYFSSSSLGYFYESLALCIKIRNHDVILCYERNVLNSKLWFHPFAQLCSSEDVSGWGKIQSKMRKRSLSGLGGN